MDDKPQPIPMVGEEEATAEVAEIYAAVKRELQLPFVPNFIKSFASSPSALAMLWEMNRALFQNMTIPQSLVAMIGFTVAEHNNCRYCSASNEMTCRITGIDEETLAGLARDLGNVHPHRVRAIIGFALKVAKDPQGVTLADYDKVRAQGVTDEELLEIVLVTALAVFNDTIADALKVQVEQQVAEALAN